MLQAFREKSKKRRRLLAQQLGVSSEHELSSVLGTVNQREQAKSTSDHHSADLDQDHTQINRANRQEELDMVSRRVSDGCSVSSMIRTARPRSPAQSNFTTTEASDKNCPSTYKDSSTFLKGTQSANPHNDYCQHFVDTGQRPQNFIRDVGLADRFEEYPKLKELIRLKDELIATTASPPMYLKADLKSTGCFCLSELKGKFDVILIEPPLEEYHQQESLPSSSDPAKSFWNWDEIMSLPIEDVAAQRSFVFLWVGSSDGLDLGRKCLRKWGFRRCEDICWIKTNIKNPENVSKNALDPKAIFQRTKEHCLMGIKGTVRRSTDGDFIHANVDIDLIITEEPPFGDTEKPEEIFHIIEHFCLGRRRLHVFGRDSTIRPGWLTVGPHLTNSNFNSDVYWNFFEGSNGHLTSCTDRIEALRPKSPPLKSKGAAANRNNSRR